LSYKRFLHIFIFAIVSLFTPCSAVLFKVQQRPLNGPQDTSAADMSRDSFVTGSRRGVIRVYDFHSMQLQQEFSNPDSRIIRKIKISSDGRVILAQVTPIIRFTPSGAGSYHLDSEMENAEIFVWTRECDGNYFLQRSIQMLDQTTHSRARVFDFDITPNGESFGIIYSGGIVRFESIDGTSGQLLSLDGGLHSSYYLLTIKSIPTFDPEHHTFVITLELKSLIFKQGDDGLWQSYPVNDCLQEVEYSTEEKFNFIDVTEASHPGCLKALTFVRGCQPDGTSMVTQKLETIKLGQEPELSQQKSEYTCIPTHGGPFHPTYPKVQRFVEETVLTTTFVVQHLKNLIRDDHLGENCKNVWRFAMYTETEKNPLLVAYVHVPSHSSNELFFSKVVAENEMVLFMRIKGQEQFLHMFFSNMHVPQYLQQRELGSHSKCFVAPELPTPEFYVTAVNEGGKTIFKTERKILKLR
jgi:hypothetical protein